MMKNIQIGSFGLALVLCLTSCTQNNSQAESTAASPPTQSTISTNVLNPNPIRITIDSLPEPFATQSASNSPNVIPVPENPTLNVPAGFQVNVFAEGLEQPRWLSLTPDGDVLVAESRSGRIRLLQDRNGDGIAETNQVFATSENGLDQPFGMTFVGNNFYVANTGEVLRFDYQSGQTSLQGTGQAITQLTPGGYNQHWTRNIIASPDEQQLYVSVGSASNASPEELPRASIQQMNLDGSERQTYAYGLRNPVGLDFHPVTNELYTTVNERDLLGDDLVPDYLTKVEPGGFYGWPYAYLTPNLLDPRLMEGNQSQQPELAAKTLTPDVLFQAHSAALGLQFYDGKQFPQRYHNGAFVAFRGSWNRNQGTGYKVVFVPFDENNRPMGYYEDFLTGFLVDPQGPDTFARPVGLLVLPDGSLLLTEDGNNRIYRISYAN
ncbi:NHL repeat containing protein [Stanieria cyanosphaera PCC 7437]|uniref:NHL repeat containing protein n=1 Tax=Stanieria cyanosphaera (strain ATCC 29371 / PCC 7437) TaxID=111780 RepID=K9XW57_STAC7|nr:sorbosone dehydrogenase family protein [Stanieria cyanosphaera]AFZ35902.1 NHL repeat containing protein [Stanieria cyanosphaera PCC 7437]